MKKWVAGELEFSDLGALVNNLSDEADEIWLFMGYVSLPHLRKLLARNSSKKIRLLLGMYYYEHRDKMMEKIISLCEPYPQVSLRFTKDRQHHKLYIFRKDGSILALLGGSANLSEDGLESPTEGEDLIFVNRISYDKVVKHFSSTWGCAHEAVDVRAEVAQRERGGGKTQTDPFSIELDLYVEKDNRKVVPQASGLNWGLQAGNSRNAGAREAYIAIRSKHVDQGSHVIPPKQVHRCGDAGKKLGRMTLST